MTMRARDKRVTCMRPFVLKGLEGVDPENPILVESRPLIEVRPPPRDARAGRRHEQNGLCRHR